MPNITLRADGLTWESMIMAHDLQTFGLVPFFKLDLHFDKRLLFTGFHLPDCQFPGNLIVN